MYDYREAMTEDVKEWIKENVDLTEWTEDREGLEQQLNEHSSQLGFTQRSP
mgnify:CR=1 FL=1